MFCLVANSDFAGDTRRYASRQYKYYRKDSNVLYLQIDRSSSASALSSPSSLVQDPYETIADEVMHWVSSERAAFNEAIQTQLRRAQWVNKWRKAKKFHIDVDSSLSTACEDLEEFSVLRALVEAKEVHVMSRSLSSDSVKERWNQLCQEYAIAHAIAALPQTWSAEGNNFYSDGVIGDPSCDSYLLCWCWCAGFAIRAEENMKRMQSYMSHIPSPHTPCAAVPSSPQYAKFVEVGDYYRKRLREEKPGRWQCFFGDETP